MHEGSRTISRRACACSFNERSSSTSYAELEVPEGDVSRSASGNINLHQNSSRKDIRKCEEHIRDLSHTNVARVSDLEHRARVAFITEVGPVATNR